MKRFLTAILALTLTGCFSNKGSDTTTTPGGGGPKPPVTAIKGVFRKNAPVTPAANIQGLAAPVASTVSTTMSTPRKYHTGINLLDGKVLIFGGSSDDGALTGLSSAETFDPATEMFTPVGAMTQARVTPSGCRMPDGRVVVVGGVFIPAPVVDIYDPATQTWTGLTVTNLYQTNSYWGKAAVFALPGNKVLFYGGQSYLVGEPFWGAQVIDLNTATTTQLPDAINQRAKFPHLILNDGRILVTGGETPSGTSADIVIIDPATLTITKVGTMTAPRASHSMLQYPDGLVEIYGGTQGSGGSIVRLTSVETFNPTTNASVKVGDLAAPRSLMESNILQNGISLHGGGPDKDGKVSDAQLTYEHGTNVATVTNQMVQPRAYFVSLVMNNGRVLYAGGTTDGLGHVTNTAEIFDSYSLIMVRGSTDQVILDPVTQATIQMTLVAGGPVTWTATVGIIDAAGLWTAPKWNPTSKTNPTKVRITATSTTDSTIKASFDATLVGYVEPEPAP